MSIYMFVCDLPGSSRTAKVQSEDLMMDEVCLQLYFCIVAWTGILLMHKLWSQPALHYRLVQNTVAKLKNGKDAKYHNRHVCAVSM